MSVEANTRIQDDWNPIQVTDYPAEYDRLRAQRPLAYTSDYDGFYDFMRYQDVQKGSRDWRTYASGQPFLEFPEFMRSIPIQENPPTHTFFRKFLARYFTPERVDMLIPDIEEIVAANLDPLIEAGEADMIEQFGAIVPQQVLAKFMLLPDDAWKTMAASLAKADAVRHDIEAMREVNKNLWNPTVESLIEDRRANPQDPSIDIMSGVLELEPEGRPVTQEEAVAIGVQIFSAGADTTTAAIGSILSYLGSHPEAQAELRSNPDLIESAVEELLRLAPPLHHTGRKATRDVKAYSITIPAGAKVGLNVYSANRDEDKFERGNEYVADRSPNPHLTFGHGPHQCMGAPIARAELQTMLRQILAKTSHFELAAEPVSNGRPLRTGWSHVRVRFEK
ncbi:cytochrome P450 [Arthrobacter sp. GCM10027362]|uniref:cytochrome P450 n=1 Tax=Arthrobacter sp. GCM10027362 TaxID=3273379 RepID=UPI00362F0C96